MQFERQKRRLIVVSNRLPVTIEKDSQTGIRKYSLSSGGLVSALTGLRKQYSFVWVGWPGVYVDSLEEQEEMSKELMSMHQCIPVFIEEHIANLYGNVFCNQLLWPVFHYTLNDIEYDSESWEAYKVANAIFAQAISKITTANDVVWVHDYHLMVLPGLLREEFAKSSRNSVKIGFFLHTPFPASDIFRTIPTAAEILKGLIGGDLVGFHTYDYQRHFLASCTTLLGLFPNHDSLALGEQHKLAVGVFPIGIEPEKFIQALDKESVCEIMSQIRERNSEKLIMLGVERLDYVKGVPNKLIAFERFLQRFPQYLGKVIFVEIAVPSRTGVEEYRSLRTTVNELVGHLNGTFGSINYIPVHYLNKSVSFDELVALYAVADVCVISSIRDGMNLVAFEYIASHSPKGDGSLIISEFAGAAHSLNGAIIVNQWNVDELADAYAEALGQTREQKKKNFSKLSAYVAKQTAVYWGERFVERLDSAAENYCLPASSSVTKTQSQTMKPESGGGDSKNETKSLTLSFAQEFVKDPQNLLAIEMGHLRGQFESKFIGRLIERINAYSRENVLIFEEGNIFIDHKSSSSPATAQESAASKDNNRAPSIQNHSNLSNHIWKNSIKDLFSWYQKRFSIEVSVKEEFDAISFKIASCPQRNFIDGECGTCNVDSSSSPISSSFHKQQPTYSSFNQMLFNDFFMNAELRLSHFPVKIELAQNCIKIIGVESERHAMMKRLFQERKFKKICYISHANDETHLFVNDWGEDVAYTCSFLSPTIGDESQLIRMLAKYVLVDG